MLTNSIVQSIILLVMILILIIICLISVYFITPNNYIICKIDDDMVLIKSKKNIIQENSYHKYTYENYKNKYIRFNNESIQLYFNHFLKSQTIINNTDLILLKDNTDIIIYNNSNEKLEINYDIYEKINSEK